MSFRLFNNILKSNGIIQSISNKSKYILKPNYNCININNSINRVVLKSSITPLHINKFNFNSNSSSINKIQYTSSTPQTPSPPQQQHNNNNNQKDEKEEKKKKIEEKNKAIGMYVLITIIGVLGLSYAAVPLYRIFCRATGYGGTIREAEDYDPTKKRDLNRQLYPIKVSFTASTANKIPWTFKPTQSTIECLPGEPVLCFYRATNNTDTPIIGVATYNITPMKAGTYFTKIQCFCFDEQRINANETIDMPVLFVIEPEMLDDKNMKNVTDITLSYTFFKSNDQGEYEEI